MLPAALVRRDVHLPCVHASLVPRIDDSVGVPLGNGSFGIAPQTRVMRC